MSKHLISVYNLASKERIWHTGWESASKLTRGECCTEESAVCHLRSLQLPKIQCPARFQKAGLCFGYWEKLHPSGTHCHPEEPSRKKGLTRTSWSPTRATAKVCPGKEQAHVGSRIPFAFSAVIAHWWINQAVRQDTQVLPCRAAFQTASPASPGTWGYSSPYHLI